MISLPKLLEKMRSVLGFLDPQPIRKGTIVKSITEFSNIYPTGINITPWSGGPPDPRSLFSRHPKIGKYQFLVRFSKISILYKFILFSF